MQKITEKLILDLLQTKDLNLAKLEKLKKNYAKKYKISIIPNTSIIEVYQNLVKVRKIKPDKNFEEFLKTKKTRSLSGIVSIAIFTKPIQCPGKCIYCPDQKNMPKSYIDNEPAVMRAVLCNYDPIKQIKARIKALEINGHPTDKIELIVMGGTWSVHDKKYKENFIKKCFQACNTKESQRKLETVSEFRQNSLLETEQKRNEKAKHRIIGLTLETRPDYIDEKEIIHMRKLGATRVELGVQSIYNDVLNLCKRGHLIDKTIKATKLLKDAGFKINYHMMPNLPGSNKTKDLKMFEELFSKEEFQPDMLKIYPCVLTKYSELYKLWKKKQYKPYSDQEIINLLIKIKQKIPKYVRIMRLGRDIPANNIIAGNKISNIRQEIERTFKKKNLKCNCIRCREVRDIKFKMSNVKLKRHDYKASEGKEIFLSFEDIKNDKLLAFLRLRIPSYYFTHKSHYIKALDNSSIIRELHTYGELIPIHNKGKVQHFGFGKKLIKEAEKITKSEFKLNKIVVISGIGVRGYYRKLGYRLNDDYMTKSF